MMIVLVKKACLLGGGHHCQSCSPPVVAVSIVVGSVNFWCVWYDHGGRCTTDTTVVDT